MFPNLVFYTETLVPKSEIDPDITSFLSQFLMIISFRSGCDVHIVSKRNSVVCLADLACMKHKRREQ